MVVEGTDSNTGIVFDIEEGEGEMKMIMESTKIGGGEEEIGKEGEGRGEEMKGREAGMAGEEGRGHITSSFAKPLHNTGALSSLNPLGSLFGLLLGL